MTRANPLPRTAGKTFNVGDSTSASCLTFETRPTTPEEVRRYRKSYFAEPGARIAHPGLIQDLKMINPMTKFGVSTSASQHIEDIMTNAPTSEYQRINEQKSEANYIRHTREPLGKSYSRNHVLPSHMRKPEYAFGITGTFGESAKELLYPSTSLNNKQDEAMYKKSHGSMEPGEQKNRQYSWEAANIDPTKFRFGLKKIVHGMDGAATAAVLNPEMDETQPQSPVVTAVQVQDMRSTLDHLGKPRHIGAASTSLPPNHTFGIRLIKDNENAKDCIQGHYSIEEQQPDRDVGKPVNHGWKNVSLDDRSFGIPSVRSDIPLPQRRSIADGQNYGDDCSSKELLYPEEFCSNGVRDVEFSEPRERSFLEQMFIQIGYHVPAEDLQCVWNDACEHGRYTSKGNASIADYRDAVNNFLEAKERGPVALTVWRQKNQAS